MTATDLGLDLRLDHLAIARRFADDPSSWPVAPRFNPSERWYHRLHIADDHEVWLLTWLPGQGTDLHDHGGSAGAFHVFAGTLTEDTVAVPATSAGTSAGRDASSGPGGLAGSGALTGRGAEAGPESSAGPRNSAGLGSSLVSGGLAGPRAAGAPRIVGRELGEGAGRRFGAQHIHRITNRSNTPAISIHAYGPALTTMTRYRIGAGGLSVETVERAGAQW